MNSNNFNFDQKELGVLRAFLKQDKLKIVVVGSFALYGIKNQNHDNKLQLKFNDLDVDIYKSLYEEISKSLATEKRRDEKVAVRVNHHFDQIASEIEDYANVKSVDIWLTSGNLDERDGNKGTFGGELEFRIFKDSDDDDKPQTVKVDINFENKNFDIEVYPFNIEGVNYDVSTYAYEKMLADKYIAFIKHYKYTINSYLNSGSMLTNNGGVSGNVKKLWKDSYDINYINSKQIVDIEKVKKYILMMVEYEINITTINSFIESLKELHPNITKHRDGYENIQNVILKHCDVILYKAT